MPILCRSYLMRALASERRSFLAPRCSMKEEKGEPASREKEGYEWAHPFGSIHCGWLYMLHSFLHDFQGQLAQLVRDYHGVLQHFFLPRPYMVETCISSLNWSSSLDCEHLVYSFQLYLLCMTKNQQWIPRNFFIFKYLKFWYLAKICKFLTWFSSGDRPEGIACALCWDRCPHSFP